MTTGALGTVERMIGAGFAFEDIEQYIESLALPSEQLGALWLLAWAEATDPLTRRQVVAQALAGSDEPADPPRGSTPSLAGRTPREQPGRAAVGRVRSRLLRRTC